MSSVVLQALGFQGVSLHDTTVVLQCGDIVVLCTDGFWRAFPPGRLADLLTSGREYSAASLVEAALPDANDNVAVAVARVSELNDVSCPRAACPLPKLDR